MAQLIQPSLTGGELSPSLYARVDVARYQQSVRHAKNFLVRPNGGLVNRPGFTFINATRDSTQQSRLLPFKVGVEIAYVLELGPNYLRACANGALVTEDPIAILAIAGDTITLDDESFGVDDWLLIGGLYYRVVSVVPSGGDFDFTLVRVDGATPAPAGTTAARVFQLTTPWASNEIADVRFTQSADTMFLTHSEHPTQLLKRTALNAFALTEFQTLSGPLLDPNGDDSKTMWVSGDRGTVTLYSNFDLFDSTYIGSLVSLWEREPWQVKPWQQGERGLVVGDMRRSGTITYVVTDVPPFIDWAETGDQAPAHLRGRAWDGPVTLKTDGTNHWTVGIQWEAHDDGQGIVKIESVTDAKTATGTVTKMMPLACVGGPATPDNTWILVGDGSTTAFAVAGAAHPSQFDYYVTIDGVPVTSAVLNNPYNKVLYIYEWAIYPDIDMIYFRTAPPVGADIRVYETDGDKLTDVWALGAWSPQQGFPAEGEFFGDRLFFGNTRAQPQTLWASQTADYSNFGVSNPIEASDAITATINARQLNAVQDLIALETLLVMTNSGEWRVTGGADDVIAPNTVGFKPTSYHGVSNVPALIVGDSAIFIERSGTVVRDMTGKADPTTGYRSIDDDLRIFASHLTDGHRIIDWAYQQYPYSIVWLVRDDGVLLTMTYMREQAILAWTPMEIDGQVESISCVPEGTEDAVYVIVRRTVDGTARRYIERLNTRFFSDVRECKFLDSMLTFDGRNTSSTTIEATGASFAVDEEVTLTASAPLFDADDVDDQIVLGYRSGSNARLAITGFTDSQHVTAQVRTVVPDELQGVAVLDWAFARNTMQGLDHLEGMTVGILSDGFAPPQQVVTDGQIVLTEPGALVHVGLPYMSDFESLDLNITGQQTIRLRAKNIKRIGLVVEDTRSIKYGPSFDALDEYESRQDEDYLATPALLQEALDLWISSDWAVNGRVCVRQDDPLPMTLLAIIPDFELGQ